VVGLFDGSTAVNLHIVSGQLGALAAKRKSGQSAARLAALFDRTQPVPWRGFPRDTDMRYTSDGRDEIVEGLLDAPRLEPVADLVAILVEELARIDDAWSRDLRPNSTARFTLAQRYSVIHAAAACIHTWQHNPSLAQGDWLVAALHRLIARLRTEAPAAPEPVVAGLFATLQKQFDEKMLFSLTPFPLAGH